MRHWGKLTPKDNFFLSGQPRNDLALLRKPTISPSDQMPRKFHYPLPLLTCDPHQRTPNVISNLSMGGPTPRMRGRTNITHETCRVDHVSVSSVFPQTLAVQKIHVHSWQYCHSDLPIVLLRNAKFSAFSRRLFGLGASTLIKLRASIKTSLKHTCAIAIVL